MSNILELLRGSSRAYVDRRAFYKSQILFWMLAATDGHAKNHSIFHKASGTYHRTPLYDLLSVWPIIGNKANQISWHDARLAMAFRSKKAHYKLSEIQPRHFFSAAGKLGLAGEIASIIEEILGATPKVISSVEAMLPPKFPQQVANSIFISLKESAGKIQKTA